MRSSPATVPAANPLRWAQVVQLIEDVMGDAALLGAVVTEVRSAIREISGLDPADVARHTRGLLAAATRAIAERRAPTQSELAALEDLAVTRARQGIPIHAVLAAIHVAERRVWASARSAARAEGVPPELVLEARELYDDWAALVRERLIVTHTAATRSALARRDDDLLRRLLAGGSAAALAARMAGLIDDSSASMLVVAVAPGLTPDEAQLLLSGLRSSSSLLGPVGIEDGDVVAVWRRAPRTLDSPVPLGVSAPMAPEALPSARAQATAAARAARRRGLTGLVPAAGVATLSAIEDRHDLAALLLDAHEEALRRLPRATEVLSTVQAWLESGRDCDRAAGRLFVHPNTVRNRVNTLCSALEIDADDPFRAVDLWWLCAAWAERQGARHSATDTS